MATVAAFLLSFSPLPERHNHLLPCSPARSHLLLPFSNPNCKKKKTSDSNGRPGNVVSARARKSDSAKPPDRLISAACYFYPFLDGVQYGKYVLTQFPALQILLQPLVPAIRLFKAFPLNGFLVFLTLYFAVVRNPGSFSRYVRFNTMQAIVLDVLLIFPDLLERSFAPREGPGLDLVMSLDSTVFLFLLVSLVYGSTSCLLGQVPRLPIVADAADSQVM